VDSTPVDVGPKEDVKVVVAAVARDVPSVAESVFFGGDTHPARSENAMNKARRLPTLLKVDERNALIRSAIELRTCPLTREHYSRIRE